MVHNRHKSSKEFSAIKKATGTQTQCKALHCKHKVKLNDELVLQTQKENSHCGVVVQKHTANAKRTGNGEFVQRDSNEIVDRNNSANFCTGYGMNF